MNTMMDLILKSIAAGVIGTLVMDLFNLTLARAAVITQIDIKMIGRMAAGWLRGHFRYTNPSEIKIIPNETFFGFAAHYLIGISLALPYIFGWDLLVGGPASPFWAIVYGVASTAGSFFLIYPSMGLGAFGKHAPEGIKAAVSSLANHTYYGAGMALWLVLI